MSKTWDAIKDGAMWTFDNRVGLSMIMVQYAAIIVSIKHHNNADLVLWVWGLVAFFVGAITGASGKFNSGFWFVVQLIFGGLLAVCGYFFLP